MEIFFQLLGAGAIGSIIIKLLDLLGERLKRKDQKEDKEDEQTKRLDGLEKEIKGLKDEVKDLKREQAENKTATEAVAEGQRVMLKDKLITNAKKYIDRQGISFDELQDWHSMHDAYHALGGNGDLNILRDKLDALPITVNKYIQMAIKE